jgi:hypothetical protein
VTVSPANEPVRCGVDRRVVRERLRALAVSKRPYESKLAEAFDLALELIPDAEDRQALRAVVFP